mmetsp:Transcript_11492/g.27430  ORF Transcript_11492/g.27430 Transcript_11492/m.27430 type:complete len:195 (-) Transcript_11492:3990-4574(-)
MQNMGIPITFRALALAFFATSSYALSPSKPIGKDGSRRTRSDLSMSAGSLSADFLLNPEETAFVFIEYQNEFTTEGGKLHDAVKGVMEETNMLENSSAILSLARKSGCTVIHAPISFEAGHDEIADSAYGILANVKEGSAFTRGEWGADFSDDAPKRRFYRERKIWLVLVRKYKSRLSFETKKSEKCCFRRLLN